MMTSSAQQNKNIYPIQKEDKKDPTVRIMTRNKRKTLIVGWNRESLRLFDKIKDYPALNYDVKGFISLKKNGKKLKYRDVHLLGDVSSLQTWIKILNIEEILIAIEPDQQRFIKEIIQLCEITDCRYRVVSDVFDTVYGHAIQDIYKSLFSKKSEFGPRRVIDLLGSVTLLVLLFPVYLIIFIAIKLDSHGPVFYSQIRTGKDGRAFRIYKFRSMVQDAEKQTGPTWALKKDPRITRVGQFMRITRIDELPQLLNILKGDMSFVGPRPERPFFVDTFKEQIPLYINRLKVKPGVTGWAQVKWRYDENIEDVKEKLKYDLYYINHHSLWLDIKIYFLTIITVLTQKGQ